MFNAPVPQANASFLPNEEALVKLITDKSVDVVAVIAGQPAKLLVDMKPEARNLIRLLKFDPSQPASQAALKTYVQATVRASSYPNLLAEDLPGLAVKAFLVTYDFSLKATEDSLRSSRGRCARISRRCRRRGIRSGARSSSRCPTSGADGSTIPPPPRASHVHRGEGQAEGGCRARRARSRSRCWGCASSGYVAHSSS